MRCSSEAWVGGMVWGGVGGIGQPATTTTHVSLRVFRAFPTPLIFLYFIISVQLQSVSESLSLSGFFLSIFEFFSAFFGEGDFSCTRGACCVDSRARVFPTRGAVIQEGGVGVVLRLGSGMMARTTRMTAWPE